MVLKAALYGITAAAVVVAAVVLAIACGDRDAGTTPTAYGAGARASDERSRTCHIYELYPILISLAKAVLAAMRQQPTLVPPLQERATWRPARRITASAARMTVSFDGVERFVHQARVLAVGGS